MNAGYCLMCNDNETSEYTPGNGADFVCSRCVQLLLTADQILLIRAYQKARDTGYTDKARAIESFLSERTFDHERKAEKPKRGLVREKISRLAGPSRDQIWTQPSTF